MWQEIKLPSQQTNTTMKLITIIYKYIYIYLNQRFEKRKTNKTKRKK